MSPRWDSRDPSGASHPPRGGLQGGSGNAPPTFAYLPAPKEWEASRGQRLAGLATAAIRCRATHCTLDGMSAISLLPSEQARVRRIIEARYTRLRDRKTTTALADFAKAVTDDLAEQGLAAVVTWDPTSPDAYDLDEHGGLVYSPKVDIIARTGPAPTVDEQIWEAKRG